MDELFSHRLTTTFTQTYIQREKLDIVCYDQSLSKTLRSIPIRPDTKETDEADVDRTFVPLGILQHNIGSNAGLFKILMELRVEEKQKPHIPALLVDCNIYWRVMKVGFMFISQLWIYI